MVTFVAFCLNSGLASNVTANPKNAIPIMIVVDCPDGHVCWPKCCPENSVFDLELKKCSDTTQSFLPLKTVDLFDVETDGSEFPTLTEIQTQNFTPAFNLGLKLAKLCKGKVNFKSPQYTVRLLTMNRLYVDNNETVEIYNQNFCVERFVNRSTGFSEISAFLCFPYTPQVKHPSPNIASSCVAFFNYKVRSILVFELFV